MTAITIHSSLAVDDNAAKIQVTFTKGVGDFSIELWTENPVYPNSVRESKEHSFVDGAKRLYSDQNRWWKDNKKVNPDGESEAIYTRNDGEDWIVKQTVNGVFYV
jgi:hypothetical protein|nr:MAG: hypothetical protein [uncultured cyanophage]